MTTIHKLTPARAFKAGELAVEIFPNQSAMAAAAASAVAGYLQQLIASQGDARVIFASATSQVQFLDALVAIQGIDWSKVTLFHMDEYLGITDKHPASFRRFLRERVVTPVHPGTVHYLLGDALEPMIECERYSSLLLARPIDLCCLGIGENGHIAFNDPPVANFSDPRQVKIVKLDLACRQQQVGEGCFPTLNDVPQYALTLTIPALCRANRLFCIVPERRKAEAVKNALRGAVQTNCPAAILRRQPQATLYLDADSGALV